MASAGASAQCLPPGLALRSFPRLYVHVALTIKSAVDSGRPFGYAFLWAPYCLFGLLLLLLKAGGSRFKAFTWQLDAFGGDHFWMSEGVWACAYRDVDAAAKSFQRRDAAFAAITAPTPELWNRRIVLFLSNSPGENEWSAFRTVLHQMLSGDVYAARVAALDAKVREAWGSKPAVGDLNDAALVSRLVAASVFFVFTGKWVTRKEAVTLSKWFSYAGLPPALRTWPTCPQHGVRCSRGSGC